MLIYKAFIFPLILLIISCQEEDEFCIDKTKIGDNCTDLCNPNCQNSFCYKNGTCENCPEGKSGDQCDIECKSNICKVCDKIDHSICLKCKDNYYLKDKECYNCSEGCKDGKCGEGGECDCIEGYYGNTCKNKCENCPEGGCNKDGKCINEILDCKDLKHFGLFCNQSCSDDCDSCDRNGNCYKCKNESKYGLKCEKNCTNCPKGICDINGICNDTENDCLNKLYFGKYCNQTCNSDKKNCKECRRNGVCISCNNDEFYGGDCKESCERCFNGTCNMDGTCKFPGNCSKGYYYGISCNLSCENDCSTNGACDIEGKCIKCDNESYYGEKCQNNCIDKCYENKCDINGICKNKDKCAYKYLYGERCNNTCIDNCYNSSCRVNGECESGCSSKFYELPFCSKKCSSKCKDLTCNDTNGICSGCADDRFYGNFCNLSVEENLNPCIRANQDGESCLECDKHQYFGKKCETSCNIGCKDQKCQIDGKCEGCSALYYGLYCNNTCNGCGEIGCDDQGYCKDFKCVKGKYGLKCDGVCECGDNSNSLECGKFSKECLNCKFGYFGTQCEKRCNFKCKTGLCCLSKEEELKAKMKLEVDYRYLTINLNNKNYIVEIDYNYGFPLTLFGSSDKATNCTNIQREQINMDKAEESISHYDFTNYYTIGSLYKNCEIILENGQNVKTDIVIASDVNCRESPKEKNISGVIGLGFFNSISIGLFNNKSNEQNILSYSLKKDDKNKIELLFGSLSKEQEDYIEKLTSCKVVFGLNTDIQGKKMTCELNGIKSSKHSTALRLDNATITFSLREDSSFILGGNENYRKYLKNEYLDDECEEENINGTYYYYYPADKINKLHNFGFVFNNYFYSYEPDKLFSDEVYKNNKKRFLIEYSDNINKTDFILGKKLLEDIKLTINIEEAIIYFYAQNAEFSDKFKDYEESSGFSLHMGARELAAISLSIVIFFDIIAFVLYYYLKNRKKKSNIIKIE